MTQPTMIKCTFCGLVFPLSVGTLTSIHHSQSGGICSGSAKDGEAVTQAIDSAEAPRFS